LIDSTLLIQAERQRLTPERLIQGLIDRWGDVELAMSVMSAGELFHGCWRADTPERRARREEFVESILAAVPVVDVTLPVVRIFGRLDAELSAGGNRVPASDLLIASTALFHGDPIVTGNFRHFARIPGLTIYGYE
jgi:predicted nucleic acid-binding protein